MSIVEKEFRSQAKAPTSLQVAGILVGGESSVAQNLVETIPHCFLENTQYEIKGSETIKKEKLFLRIVFDSYFTLTYVLNAFCLNLEVESRKKAP